MIALQLAEKQNFENLKYKKKLSQIQQMIELQLAEKQNFENLKYKKTLADLADLADD